MKNLKFENHLYFCLYAISHFLNCNTLERPHIRDSHTTPY